MPVGLRSTGSAGREDVPAGPHRFVPSGRRSAMPRRFADLSPGDTYDCGTATASREEVVAFAREFDPLPIHTDPAAAAASPFGDLVASGIHTLALSQPPVVGRFYADSGLVAARGMANVDFPTPLRPDREMRVTLTVEDCRPSERDPGRGLVTTRRTCETDDGVVLDLTNTTVWIRD